jgi:putative ABC transport system permease protein
LFYPSTQSASPRFIAIVRTQEGAPPPIDAIRAIVRDLDPALPVFEMQSVEAIVGKATSAPRWGSTLVTGFAGMALLLAAVGIAGTVAYCASQRSKECGIRLALGAAPKAVGWLVARQGVWPVMAGIAVGFAATRLVEPVFRGLLFGVAASAVAPIVICVSVLTVACGVAALLPARRATAIDPAVTLRCD